MTRIFTLTGLAMAILIAACVGGRVLAQEKYKSFRDAMQQAARLHNNQEYAASQEPFEAALRLAPDDKARLDAYEGLKASYRLLPEIDKMLEAVDFILRHKEQRAGRSLASREVASFLHQRGKVDVAVERYEKILKDDPQDVAALSVLATIFTHVKRDKTRGPELTKQVEEVDRAIARRAAERNEKDAESAPQLAGVYLKDAAVAWLEAGDSEKALAAAKKALAGPPEQRNDLLKYYWHDALGDVFLKTGEPQSAVAQYEAAIAVAKIEGYRKNTEKKLEEARAAATKT